MKASSMPITPDDVTRTAELARLHLSADERKRFEKDLARITEYMAQLSEAVADETSSATVLPLIPDAQALREDRVCMKFDSKQVVAQAPDKKNNLFRVPKVLG